MLPQESMVCSSRPFLFLIEQMERHSLADLKQVELCFFGVVCTFQHLRKLTLNSGRPGDVEDIDLHVQPFVPLGIGWTHLHKITIGEKSRSAF